MVALGLGDSVEDGHDLVRRLVGVAADLELDEGRVPVLCNLISITGSERRANVLNSLQLGHAVNDVLDRSGEPLRHPKAK